MVSRNTSHLIDSQITAAQYNFRKENSEAKVDQTAQEHNARIEQDYKNNQNRVGSDSRVQGVDPKDKNFVENNVEGRVTFMRTDNEERILREKQENESAGQEKQAQVNKLEENRIGQGFVGKKLGIGGPY